MLEVHGLVTSLWSMGDRSGVSFRASRIETANQGRTAARSEAA